MSHCRTCTCARTRPSASSYAELDTAAVEAVAGGAATAVEVATLLGGGDPLPADRELVRRALDREVRRGRLVVAERSTRGGPGGTTPTRYAVAT